MLFVFMSQPDFACNSYALWEFIKKNTEHETAWLLMKEEKCEKLRERGIRCAVYDTLDGNALIEEANYIIANSYTFVNIPKRKDQILVNLWHGSGIKAHDYFHRNTDINHLRRISEYIQKIDLMCVHSLDDRFRLSAMLHYDLRNSFVTGQPRLDSVQCSDGKEKLHRLYGDKILSYDKLIFFVPSFRANMSGHSGKFFCENVFRLDDYNDADLQKFLEERNAALMYKLHPIEQNAFSKRKFHLNQYCYQLTDEMLFENDIRYDEILNAFDVMISDYSSIAYDFLLLDRPIIYLIPDYNDYKYSKGFVFHNIDYYMPGDKVFTFVELLAALKSSFENAERYENARKNVIEQRFDYVDNQASRRCYDTIMSFKPIEEKTEQYAPSRDLMFPSTADHLVEVIGNEEIQILDSTKSMNTLDSTDIAKEKNIYYVTGELPNEFYKLSDSYCYKIKDIKFYWEIKKNENIKICHIEGGVDCNKFRNDRYGQYSRKSIGYAGIIDSRIYFAMVQTVCEAFPDYEVIFAGKILGDFPTWLKGYENLTYIEASYDDLPEIIASFDIAFLPFYGKHRKTVPSELFQYLAMGKCVLTSDMPNLPECEAVFRCESIDESVKKIKEIESLQNRKMYAEQARLVAMEYDWNKIAGKMLKGELK